MIENSFTTLLQYVCTVQQSGWQTRCQKLATYINPLKGQCQDIFRLRCFMIPTIEEGWREKQRSSRLFWGGRICSISWIQPFLPNRLRQNNTKLSKFCPPNRRDDLCLGFCPHPSSMYQPIWTPYSFERLVYISSRFHRDIRIYKKIHSAIFTLRCQWHRQIKKSIFMFEYCISTKSRPFKKTT